MIQRGWLALVLLAYAVGARAEEPLARFGLWADVQYADRPSTYERDYRGSKDRLAEAIDWLNAQHVSFTVSLGDWVDRNLSSYDTLAPLLARADSAVYPVLGNHEAYEFGRDSLAAVARLRGIGFSDSYYYTIDRGAVRLLVLNTNRNAMTDTQLAWIETQLQQAERQDQAVIVLSHHPLYYDYVPQVLAPRADAVCALLARYKNRVKVCFAGHFHYGGYHYAQGIHHFVVQGMVQKPSTEWCWVVSLFADRITLETPRGTHTSLFVSR